MLFCNILFKCIILDKSYGGTKIYSSEILPHPVQEKAIYFDPFRFQIGGPHCGSSWVLGLKKRWEMHFWILKNGLLFSKCVKI